MAGIISINEIWVKDNRIECAMIAEGDVAKAFRKNKLRFFYEVDISLADLPPSIAVIPLLAQILPISWYFDATIRIPECDQDFLESIASFKAGYSKMYPTFTLAGGRLEVATVTHNERLLAGALSLFSGGLDAHDTAIRHADEKPLLVVVQGADIGLRNDSAWNVVLGQVDDVAHMLETERVSVKSNFRHMLNYKRLDSETACIPDTWWHAMQYGIGLISLTAPIAWVKRIGTVYIASSYSEESKGRYSCASDPTIDNHVRFFGVRIEHDGYQFSRLDKIRNIAQWCSENEKTVYLRVCAKRPVTGKNCCNCEKCWRTILAIYALKMNPSDFGFEYDDLGKVISTMHRKAHLLLRNFSTRYMPIVALMRENYSSDEVRPDLKWLYDIGVSAESEIFQWINTRVIGDRANIVRKKETVKEQKTAIRRLEVENEKLLRINSSLAAEVAGFKASILYRLWAKKNKICSRLRFRRNNPRA